MWLVFVMQCFEEIDRWFKGDPCAAGSQRHNCLLQRTLFMSVLCEVNAYERIT